MTMYVIAKIKSEVTVKRPRHILQFELFIYVHTIIIVIKITVIFVEYILVIVTLLLTLPYHVPPTDWRSLHERLMKANHMYVNV